MSSLFEVAGRGDDHLAARLGEKLVNLGTTFDGARFRAIRTKRDQVCGEGEQDAFINDALPACRSLHEERSPMSQRGQGTLEREPVERASKRGSGQAKGGQAGMALS